MPSKSHVGKAGHLAAMAEFLLRGYNVAMPEADVGDDIFVVHDDEGQLWRIQVKTALGKRTGYGFRGQFAVGRSQLETAKKPELFFVFVLRAEGRWEFVPVSRPALLDKQEQSHVASPAGDQLVFTFRFSSSAVRCGAEDLQSYRGNWDVWPVLTA